MFTRALVTAASIAAAAALIAPAPAQAASPIQFGKIRYDSPGKDTRTNSRINGEYVVIKNTGKTSRSLKGWTVADDARHVYTFGTRRQ